MLVIVVLSNQSEKQQAKKKCKGRKLQEAAEEVK